MSIQSQATFYLRNIVDLPREKLAQAIHADGEDILAGLDDYRMLLKQIYTHYAAFEVSTAGDAMTKVNISQQDLENYHHLTETMEFFCKTAGMGRLKREGNICCLETEKAALKKVFKKPAAFPISLLEKYGFYFHYYKDGKEVDSYQKCTVFHLYYDNSLSLIPAVKMLADSLPDISAKTDFISSPKEIMFALADCEHTILGESTKKEDINPYQENIYRTAGNAGTVLKDLVYRLKEDGQLDTDVVLNAYVLPRWTIRFTRKKKTILTAITGTDYTCIRVPLSYEAAKWVIRQRKRMPQSVQDCISRFGCIQCGKCENQSNIEMFEGISLCRSNVVNFLTEDARIMHIMLASQEENAAIVEIVKWILSA